MAFKTTIESHWNGDDVKIKGKQLVGKTAFEIGLFIEGQAKLLSPKKTGRLAGSITVAAKTQRTDPTSPLALRDIIQAPVTENEVFIGTPVFYGPYNEFGTVRQDAQPFLRPAADLANGKALTIGELNGKFFFKDYLQ